MKKSILIALLVFSILAGCTASTPPTGSGPTTTPIPSSLLPVRGLYVQFDRRGWASEYWSGQVISDFNTQDSVVGHSVADEVALQLDQMIQMGVNTIAFELRSSSSDLMGPFTPPTCNLPPVLGLQYPQPTPQEITNLVSFLDLLHSKGLKVYLRLVNSHMDEQPPSNNELWLGTILTAIKDHPALDLVLFEGDAFMIDTNGDNVNDSCGGLAEPPLWEGPTSVAAKYVEWAIEYAHSLGLPYRKLSAEAIVGNYFIMSQTPNPFMTDGHFWDPILVLKGIFDNLSVPDDQRTYAISFYEHRKCSTANDIPCVDENPHEWAVETATDVFDTIGRGNGARVVAVEMGLMPPVEPSWTTEMALESLVWVMHTSGMEGGCFWRWVDFDNNEESDPTLAEPIKKRGLAFDYNPVKDVLQALYTVGKVDNPAFDPGAVPTGSATSSVNPASLSPDDDFSGLSLDLTKWTPQTSGDATVTQSDRLVLSVADTSASSTAVVQSTWAFTGDFDFQVDFQIETGWSAPAQEHLDGAVLGVSVNGQSFHITRLMDARQDVYFAWSSDGTLSGSAPATQLSGSYRLVRTGSQLVLYYDNGAGWQELASGAVPTTPAQVYLMSGSVNASQAFTTIFDHFQVNSGQTTYEP